MENTPGIRHFDVLEWKIPGNGSFRPPEKRLGATELCGRRTDRRTL